MIVKPRYNGGSLYYIPTGHEELSFSSPFHTYRNRDGDRDSNVTLEINLLDLVDGYDYHDFPNSVDIYFGIEDLEDLRNTIDEVIKKMKEYKYNGSS